MDSVECLYNDDKLLVRAMDWPKLSKDTDDLYYDCSTWANEFCLLMNSSLSSASSTLIVPNVGVATYKNIGFLMNSDLVDCFHISKSDSGSSGSIDTGDFNANKADFQTISELASYIHSNNAINMNEVNIRATLDSVVGLFLCECTNQDMLLQLLFVVQKCLLSLTGIYFPICSYNAKVGKITRIELSLDEKMQIIDMLRTTKIFFWPDEYKEPFIDDIANIKSISMY